MPSGWQPRRTGGRSLGPTDLSSLPLVITQENVSQHTSASSAALYGDSGAELFGTAHKLPDDVWAEILEHAFAHQFPHCHSEDHPLMNTPIAFSQVSRRFRFIALHVPRIWSCVHVTAHRRKTQYDQMLRLKLDRSGSLPLTILFVCHRATALEGSTRCEQYWDTWNQFISSDEGECFRRCWELLLPHARRWHRLSLFARHAELLDVFVQERLLDRGAELPLLEHLDICAWGGERTVPIANRRQLGMARIRAPSLKCLRAHTLGVVFSMAPRFSLTELVITEHPTSVSPYDLGNGLRAVASSLKVLVLSRVVVELPHDTTSASQALGTVTFPHLQYLYLETLTAPHLATLVSWFLQSTPRLLRLDLSPRVGISVHNLLRILPSVCACPSVETLAIYSVVKYYRQRSPEDAHYPFLEAFTGLKHIITNYDSQEFVDTLLSCSKSALARDGICLWPFLECLTLHSMSPNNPSSVLAAFITHRKDANCPIKRLEISSPLAEALLSRSQDLLRQCISVRRISDVSALHAPILQRWDHRRNVFFFPWWTEFAD